MHKRNRRRIYDGAEIPQGYEKCRRCPQGAWYQNNFQYAWPSFKSVGRNKAGYRRFRRRNCSRICECYEGDGCEITTTTTTLVNEIKDGEIIEYKIDPKDYGIEYASPADLKGGEAADNAKITRDIFAGVKGPKRDIVVLNSAAGIYIGGKASSIAEGVKIAEEMIDSGKAAAKLEELIKKTKELA
jgi:hypothetical protein